MNGTTSETREATPVAASAPETPATKAARGGKKPRVAVPRAKATKKATPAKKAPKTAPKAKGSGKPKAAKPAKAAKVTGPREGSKTEKILTLLKRGTTLKELMKATGWQAHSVRGFLSAAVGKKMGLAVVSAKNKDGQRSYSIKA